MSTETLQYLSLAAALAAIVSGFIVLAPKDYWQFPDGVKPYLSGSVVAWFYLTVCGSTILSILHFLLLGHWVLAEDYHLVGSGLNSIWMGWHILTSLFVVCLHFIIFHLRGRDIDEMRLW